ncbi:MAG: hypothetical protein GY757_23190, partial [bacterium]|nr:hypothetical protein [bacterium]
FQLQTTSKFRRIPYKPGPCWALHSTGDSLLAATSKGIVRIEGNQIQTIDQIPSFVFLASRYHPGIIWCGTALGPATLSREKGKWIMEHREVGNRQEIRSLAEDKKGSLWLGTMSGDAIKMEFPGDIDKPVITCHNTSHGLPGGEIHVSTAAGHIIFATTKGLYRFDEKLKTFIPDKIVGAKFAGGAKPVFRLKEDKNKHIWFHSESRNYYAVPQSGGAYKIYYRPFRRLPTTAQVSTIYPEPEGGVTWFAGNIGLIRYDRAIKKNYSQGFQTLVRRVVLNKNRENEREIFGGRAVKTAYPVFKYEDRNLHFEFAAPSFEAEEETRYQYYLRGYDNGWSIWNEETNRIYSNISPGMYTFRVRAKNVYQQIGKEALFQFKILAPWYRTWWAYSLLGISFFLVIYLGVRWRFHQMEMHRQKLELTINQRTEEIREKNRKLKEQSEKLKELDQVKSRFFANISHEFRTPLTLIMSPLEQMIAGHRDNKEKKKLGVMLRNSQRLLTLINQLLDLSRLDSGKMKLQANCQNIVSFIEEILGSFQILADQNRLELEFYSPEKNIPLYFDHLKMVEVTYNLLINAIKYTPAHGKIVVSLSIEQRKAQKKETQQENYLKISIRDTGAGIKQEDIKHIFDRFYLPDSSEGADIKSTGLGLALVKELILL